MEPVPGQGVEKYSLSAVTDKLNCKLAIYNHHAEILQKIEENKVLVITGDTGCGKSTQVPQYIYYYNACCAQRKDVRIIVAQPRRLAAINLSHRVSQEMGCTLGTQVGYHVSFDSQYSKDTNICYLTNGILLQQLIYQPNLLS